MIAEQQPFSTGAKDLSPTSAVVARAGGMRWLDAKLDEVASDPVRFRWYLTVIGLVALGWVGFVGTVMLRPNAAPQTVAALPPLVSAAPSSPEDASNSPSQPIESGRLTVSEPAPLNSDVSEHSSSEAAPAPASMTAPASGNVLRPPAREIVGRYQATPLPPARPLEVGPTARPSTAYDKWTAVYDISAHVVHLPDGTRLEAHSGLGDRLDDPRHVDERDRGATPPHLYELTLRESLFHGVQALRLTPIGEGDVFDRSGLLAHPYMLGPNGDSNGCVSFKDYDAFLRAFQNGEVKRLAVVAQSTEAPRQYVRLDSPRQAPDH